MKIELPEKFVKEPTGYPFSPVLSIEGKEIVVKAVRIFPNIANDCI